MIKMNSPHFREKRVRGFTLLEVMLAIGIFALGFAFVAAMFPAAILLQKKTVDQTRAILVAENAQALLYSRKMLATDLMDASYGLAGTDASIQTAYSSLSELYDTDMRVHALPIAMLDAANTTLSDTRKWTETDRSYPLLETSVSRRDMFWVPLIQDVNGIAGEYEWRVYVFVMKRSPNTDYSIWPTPLTGDFVRWANPNDTFTTPRVARLAVSTSSADLRRFNLTNNFNVDANGDGLRDQFEIGDQILDSNGNIYTIESSDDDGFEVTGQIVSTPTYPDYIWYAPPGISSLVGGGVARHPNPTMRIVLLPEGGGNTSAVE